MKHQILLMSEDLKKDIFIVFLQEVHFSELYWTSKSKEIPI